MMKKSDYSFILFGVAAIAVIILVFGKFSPVTFAEPAKHQSFSEAKKADPVPMAKQDIAEAISKLHESSSVDWPTLDMADTTPKSSETVSETIRPVPADYILADMGDHLAIGIKEGIVGGVGDLPRETKMSYLYMYRLVNGGKAFDTALGDNYFVPCVDISKGTTTDDWAKMTENRRADIEALCKTT
jgi:hypothetical protein